jgi:hypothetical protein
MEYMLSKTTIGCLEIYLSPRKEDEEDDGS